MVTDHATDALRLPQENFCEIPSVGLFSIPQLAALFAVSLQCIRDHLKANEIPCYRAPGGPIVDLAVFWKSLPMVAYGKEPEAKEPDDGKKASGKTRKRRRDDLPNG